MYGWLMKDRDNERGLFYDGNEMNLKYCLDPKEAKEWFEKNKDKMVMVNVKRPPDLEIPIQIPL